MLVGGQPGGEPVGLEGATVVDSIVGVDRGDQPILDGHPVLAQAPQRVGPLIDMPRALLRGRYMAAAAAMEYFQHGWKQPPERGDVALAIVHDIRGHETPVPGAAADRLLQLEQDLSAAQ